MSTRKSEVGERDNLLASCFADALSIIDGKTVINRGYCLERVCSYLTLARDSYLCIDPVFEREVRDSLPERNRQGSDEFFIGLLNYREMAEIDPFLSTPSNFIGRTNSFLKTLRALIEDGQMVEDERAKLRAFFSMALKFYARKFDKQVDAYFARSA